MSLTEAWTAKVEAGVMGAWWGRAAEQLNLPGAQSRAWETELPGWTSNAFNKYFLNRVSATIRQALLDTETAKVNERLKPGSTQVRGRAEPTSTTAKCGRVWTQGSAVSSGLCLSSSAPLCWLHFQAISHSATFLERERPLFPLDLAGESQVRTLPGLAWLPCSLLNQSLRLWE